MYIKTLKFLIIIHLQSIYVLMAEKKAHEKILHFILFTFTSRISYLVRTQDT